VSHPPEVVNKLIPNHIADSEASFRKTNSKLSALAVGNPGYRIALILLERFSASPFKRTKKE